MKIPIEIKKIIGDKAFNIDTVGLSDSQVFCFDDMVLKIQNNNDETRNEISILLDKLGFEPDWDKLRYCILLDELF